jgi:hypothetical protein
MKGAAIVPDMAQGMENDMGKELLGFIVILGIVLGVGFLVRAIISAELQGDRKSVV